MLSKELLEILCCPLTKQLLHEANLEKYGEVLLTADEKTAYPIRNGIPVLLKEEAIAL
ncbi:hypothetical protein AGMMS49938_15620 [Fibrobacterales bacterium]|nr:hypothetical protein AGMMS49938_15620 [Fibrobacterales bacterium]